MSNMAAHKVAEVQEVNIHKKLKNKINLRQKTQKGSHKNGSSPVFRRSCSDCSKSDDQCVCKTHTAGDMKIITLHNVDEDDFEREWSFGGAPSIKKNKSVWLVPLKLAGKITIFKIDTGASVTVIPLSLYESLDLNEIEPSNMMIFGASGHALDVVGQITTTISRLGSSKAVTCTVSVIRGLQQSLLGLQEITALNLVSLNLEDHDEAKTETVDNNARLEVKSKTSTNEPNSAIKKTQCWQDEFRHPFLGLGGASYSFLPPWVTPMLWMGLAELDNQSKEAMMKSPYKRKHRHRQHDNPSGDMSYDSVLITFLLKDVIPANDISSRHNPKSLTWSRHN